MKISIITTSYNAVNYIKQTIDSVLSQKGEFAIEYILQDALSTDGTWEIIQQVAHEYQNHDRINVIIESAKDGGMYAGINKGLDKMTGDIWGYLNADDILMPGALNEVAEFFINHKNTGMVYGQGLYINEHGKFFGLYPSFDIKEKPLVDNCYISQPSTFLRKEIYNKLGGFNEKIKNSGDYEYWLRVESNGVEISFIPQVLSATRIHANTKTSINRAAIQAETLAVASYYNNGHIPRLWLEEFSNENSLVARLLDFFEQLLRKARILYIKAFASLFKIGRNKKISKLRNNIFMNKVD